MSDSPLNQETEHTTAAQKKGLWGMSRPMLVEQSLQFSVPVLDTFFLSRVSDSAASAAGAMTPVLFFCVNIVSVMIYAGASIASQRLGAGSPARANATIATNAVWGILLGFLLTAVLYFVSPHITRLMGLPGQIQIDANTYMSICCWLMLVWAFKALFQSALNIYGKPQWNMFANIVYFVTNVIGNAVVVFGLFGFPKMGIEGVAWASVFGSMAGVIVSGMAVFLRLKLQICWADIRREFRSATRHSARIALPSMLEPLSFDINMIVLNGFAASLGAVALAAKVYTFNTYMLGLIISFALTMATEVLVTQHLGADRYDRVRAQMRQSLKAAVWGSGTVAFILLIFHHPIMDIYSDDEVLLASSFWIFLLATLAEPARAVNIMVGRVLRLTGDAVFISTIGPLFTWTVAIPAAYFMTFVLGWGIYGIMLSAVLDEGCRAMIYWNRWHQERWQHTHVNALEKKAAMEKAS